MSTIVALHAHPDDEALLTGGWLAQRSAAGDRVVLVVATDGEAGLADSHTGLGRRRRAEVAEAARILGVDRVVHLGYADSGMARTPTTGSGRLVDAPVAEVAGRVAEILDEEGADLLTGYDVHGGYGHPDHVQVHRIARAAQTLAGRRPELWEATLDRTWLTRLLAVFGPLARRLPGLTLPEPPIYSARCEIDRSVDVRAQVDRKRAALAAHASQRGGGVRTIALLLALPAPVSRRVLGTECFRVVT